MRTLAQSLTAVEADLDLHQTLDGYALSLVWREPGEEQLRGVPLREFPTLTAAVRMRGELMEVVR